MPKVSIIIPVYNVEKYLEKCLDSVVSQTFKNVEIICINNGSTDKSLDILNNYAKTDNRILVINCENGLSKARNKGLDTATGDYCYFLDSDDWIEPDAIEKLVNIITTYNTDVVVNNVNVIAEDDSCNQMVEDVKNYFKCQNKNGIYEVPIEINARIPAVAWNKLYKMDIIKEYNCRFPEGLINEDELFIWVYMLHCKNYYYTNDKLYNYLRRKDSVMANIKTTPKSLDRFEILKQIYQVVNKCKNIDEYKDYLTNDYIATARSFYIFIISKKYRKQALEKIKEYYNEINHDKRILKLYRELKYKKFRQFYQGIFSIRNENGHKIIKILGIKIKVKKKVYNE